MPPTSADAGFRRELGLTGPRLYYAMAFVVAAVYFTVHPRTTGRL